MNETEKQIARAKRIDILQEEYYKERNELKEEFQGMMSEDENATERIRKKCEEIIYARIEEGHSCECCRAEYPSVHLGDDGKIHCRIDADHPNDIMDWTANIDALLEGK